MLITISSSLLYVAPTAAVPMSTESNEAELLTTAPPTISENLSELSLSAPSVQVSSPKGFAPALPATDSYSGMFSSLLSSLAYEIRFTSLGRFYTSIPYALNTKNFALFSFHLLPHPEKIQSSALLTNNIFMTPNKDQPPGESQDSTILGPSTWFAVASLCLIGIVALAMWRKKKNLTLHF